MGNVGTVTNCDPIAAALHKETPENPFSKQLLLDELFADRPDVLEAVKAARKRGVTWQRIADILSAEGRRVSASAVSRWYKVRVG